MGKAKEVKIEYESVKINKGIVNLVRESKKKTGVPISVFFEKLATEKLQKEKKQ
jgi:hypothetical protein